MEYTQEMASSAWDRRQKFLKEHPRGVWTMTQIRAYAKVNGIRLSGTKVAMLRELDEFDKKKKEGKYFEKEL